MIEFIHFFIQTLICLYKWIELKVLGRFSGFIERSMKHKLGKIGIVLESAENENYNFANILKDSNKYDKICRLQLKDKHILTKIANRGYIAMGEGYVHGDFEFTNDENDITELITRCLSNNYYEYYFNFWNRLLHKLEFESTNLQTTSRAWEVGRKHYDLGKKKFFKLCSSLHTSYTYSTFRQFVFHCIFGH